MRGGPGRVARWRVECGAGSACGQRGLRLTGGPSAGRWAEASARRKGRVTRVACERAVPRVRAGPRAKGAGMLGRCEAGAGEGRAAGR